jgi:predicted transcriptional regulator
MKTASIPAIRVSPELRDEAEAVLAEGETLSGFVLEAVHKHVAHRRLEQEFIHRGLARGAKAAKSGEYVSASRVIAKLQKRLSAARAKM